MKNYYEILGVDRNADVKEIEKNAHWRLAQIGEIYLILSDNIKRKNYDFF